MPTISTKLDTALAARLRAIAKRERLTVSAVVRDAVVRLVDNAKPYDAGWREGQVAGFNDAARKLRNAMRGP